MRKTERIEWVDFLKGISILWLIVYHFYVFEWLRSPVPVFFLLSGLFYSEGAYFGSYVVKKAKALLVPFLFFFCLGVEASFAGSILSHETFNFPQVWNMATLIPVSGAMANPLGVGAIWFLVSLFEIYLFYYLVRLVSKNLWWALAVGLLVFVVSSILLQRYAMGSLFYLIYSGGFLLFFIVGHVFKETLLKGTFPWWFVALCLLGYATTFVNLGNGGGILLRTRDLVSSMSLAFILIWLCEMIARNEHVAKSGLFSFVQYEGRNSLTILGIHMLAIALMSKILVNRKASVVYYVALFVAVVLVCNVCVWLFNRYVPFLVNHRKGKNSNEKDTSLLSKE